MSSHTPNQQSAGSIFQDYRATRNDYSLKVIQHPSIGKVFTGKEKDRKPLDPPPIVQLKVNHSSDQAQTFLSSPWYFVSCSLVNEDSNGPRPQLEDHVTKNALCGTLVSSLHRLKDDNNKDGGFFIFGDISVKLEGEYRLQFTLYQVQDGFAEVITSTTSNPFKVYPSRGFPGMNESTHLTRIFSDQGVRLRLRKEPKARLQTHGPASDDYQPRTYNTQRRRQSHLLGSSVPSMQQIPEGGAFDYGMATTQAMQHMPMPVTAGERKRNHSHSSHSGSMASLNEEGSSKRQKMEPGFFMGQNYGYTQPRQHMMGSSAAMQQYPQPMTQGMNFGMSYATAPSALPVRESASYQLSTPRRGDSQYSPFDASVGSRQAQNTPGYLSQQSSYMGIPHQQQQHPPQQQHLTQSYNQGFPSTQPRTNSLDIPDYNNQSFEQRQPYAGTVTSMPPPNYQRNPNISAGFTFGAPAGYSGQHGSSSLDPSFFTLGGTSRPEDPSRQ